ncbi:MAG: RNA polymerase sigma factor [Patescibacteria group bacterium]|nr:RNA polymerase sigma factor [Patescibacteria group bacterium]
MEINPVYTGSSANLSENLGVSEALINKAKLGNQAAFTEIYNLYFKKIYKFIYFRVSHKEVAEDLAEDVFVKAYGKISSVNQTRSFESWLYQIARNAVIDYYRGKKQDIPLDEMENVLEYESNIVAEVELQDRQKTFLKLLKELKPDQQLVIKMKFLENLENSEIAAILHKNEGAIRVIQHRAIARLQELLKQQTNE